MSLGFENTGKWRTQYAVDFEETATKTYSCNFGVDTLCDSIADSNVRKSLVERFGGHIDAIVGGPPCQAYSRRNSKRDTRAYDDMKQLPHTYIDIAIQLGVSVVVMEEVAQAAKHVLPAIVARLESEGFLVQHRVLNAVDYGVAQNRKRLILVATRNGWTFAWPTAHAKRTSIREAFAEEPMPAWGAQVSDYCADRIRTVRDSNKRLIGGNYAIMDFDKPSPTVHTKTVPGAGPYAIERDGLFHTLGVQEAARLQSFPTSFQFCANETKQRKLIGNAVPPKLAQAIASGLTPPSSGTV